MGHNVLSLNPEQAPNATAKQKLEKLNLALEMGNNVMLYVDDIQHTHLNSYKNLSRYVMAHAVLKGLEGKTRTYDMRGKNSVW